MIDRDIIGTNELMSMKRQFDWAMKILWVLIITTIVVIIGIQTKFHLFPNEEIYHDQCILEVKREWNARSDREWIEYRIYRSLFLGGGE